MPIQANCSSCSHSFAAASKYAGKKVKCPKCKEPLVIPAAKSSGKDSGEKAVAKASSRKATTKKALTDKIVVQCKCGKKFGAKPEWAGKKVKCPGCEKPIQIPGGSKKAVAVKKKPKSNPSPPVLTATLDGLFDEVGFNTEDGSAHRKCPECRAAMSDEAIICIQCGYNENTGKKMETYRPVTAEDRAKNADILAEPEHMPKGGGKRKGKKKLPAEVSTVNNILYFLGIAPLVSYGLLFAMTSGALPAELDPGLVSMIQASLVTGLVVAVLFSTLPCLGAAYLLSNGKPIGRIIAMIMGGLSLFGFPIGTIIGFFLLKNAMSDAAKEHCAS